MTGPGHVVAEHDRRRRADEQRAGVADLTGPLLGFFADQVQVLRGDALGERDRLVEVGGDERRAVLPQSRRGRLSGRQVREPRVDLTADALRESGGVGDQDRDRQRIVLRLGQQVGGDARGRSAGRRDDHDLGRPGVPVDADIRGDVPLGRRDPGVARPRDQVDGTDRLRAVGERRDRVGPAHAPDLVHPDEVHNVPQHRTVPVRLGRRRDDDLLHAGEPGRHRGHQHGRRIGKAAARHVEAHPPNGDATLLDPNAVPVDAFHAGPTQQCAVIRLDRGPGAIDRLGHLGVDGGRVRRRTGSQSQRIGRERLEAVETAHRLKQGRVAAGADAVRDLRGGLPDPGRDAAPAPPVEELQMFPPGGTPGGEDAKRAAGCLSHRRSPSLRARRAGCSGAGGGRETTPG